MNYRATAETWKPCKGFEEKYEVSNFGNIKSLNKVTDYVWKGKKCFRTFFGKDISPILDSRGYFTVNLYKNGIINKKDLHRIVALTFLENPEEFPVVNHIDGNKLNNNVLNLEWCTYSHNTQHAFDIGLLVNDKGKDSSSFIAPIEMVNGSFGYVLFGKAQILSAGFDDANVYRCANGKQSNHKGFIINRFNYQRKGDKPIQYGPVKRRKW